MRRLHIYAGGNMVGWLSDEGDIWSLTYDDGWRHSADAYDLSPALPRATANHHDGSTNRPVQWFFENLLPEEDLRDTIAKEANLKGYDAWALLEYLGAESAGSLTLLPPETPVPSSSKLRPLSKEELSKRISDLPNQTLQRQAPKRMSLAGAQHKLLVVLEGNELFEPEGATPSTHILKPEHPKAGTYPASVFNEYLTMKLAAHAGLEVPDVQMMFVPQPVYIIKRFDRRLPGSIREALAGNIKRLHIIDACQLLNRARIFKHHGATLETLNEVVNFTTNKVATRLRLFAWLAFNSLVCNDDSHLKNLSFMVDPGRITLAPHYDLLSTGAYYTKAIAEEYAKWPDVKMAIPIPGASTLGEVTRANMLLAAEALGIPPRVAAARLDSLIHGVSVGLKAMREHHDKLKQESGPGHAGTFAQSDRLLRVIEHITMPAMVKQLT